MTGTRTVAAALALVGLAVGACRDTAPRPRDAAPSARPAPPVRSVVDMTGTRADVPADLTRVATISDGFVESVMARLGTIRTLVALGSAAQQRTWAYTYEFGPRRPLSFTDGMGTVRVVHPWLTRLPCASASGDGINFETLATARPEVLVVRVGDCTVPAGSDQVDRLRALFGALGIPVVVLRSPTDYRGQGPGTLRDEILLLGRVFGREAEARVLADELTDVETFVSTRVEPAPSEARPRALYLGLASSARSSGGAAFVWGTDSAESWMLERLVGARNAYRGGGSRVLLNAEQILTLDPDVIFLPTSAGYHPPEELAEAPHFRELRQLRAVRTGRVYPLPWTPMNCARRLEYPLDLMVMAKGVYPDRFRDVAVHDWALAFYRRTYGVDETQARAMRRAQWFEWAVEAGF